MHFSSREIKELAISILVLSFAFSGFDFALMLPTIFVMVAVFASHEILGHKLVAQHFECESEYRMWPLGLGLGILTGLLGGFIFAAPGAVYISPIIRKKFAFNVARLSKKEFGLIAAAGPFVNIVVGFTLLLVSVFIAPWYIFVLTAKISFILALFNLMPFPPLDGQKILSWDNRVWIALLAASIIGYVLLTYL